MANRKVKHFVIENQVSELSRLAEEIEKLADKWKMPQALAMNINLVIEEAVTNIIFYAFTDSSKHEISITISVFNNILTIELTDNGIPFDPSSHQKPDITLTAEERDVGGLGIFLISQIMDEIHYARKKNQNILTLTKSI
jgi:serine/threonine-protein kinase RsbW